VKKRDTIFCFDLFLKKRMHLQTGKKVNRVPRPLKFGLGF
jgi:hypothetical protein